MHPLERTTKGSPRRNGTFCWDGHEVSVKTWLEHTFHQAKDRRGL
jgi:hypothetical protein